jgi:hypothetical protein
MASTSLIFMHRLEPGVNTQSRAAIFEHSRRFRQSVISPFPKPRRGDLFIEIGQSESFFCLSTAPLKKPEWELTIEGNIRVADWLHFGDKDTYRNPQRNGARVNRM